MFGTEVEEEDPGRVSGEVERLGLAKTISIHASLTEDQLHNWKLLEAAQRELEPRLAHAAASEPSAPERQLTPGALPSPRRLQVYSGEPLVPDLPILTRESDSSAEIPEGSAETAGGGWILIFLGRWGWLSC